MNYDLCVIGAGWAGFNAALKAARLGKKVCLIENEAIGGTCLNRGCIPTKALIAYSKQNIPFAEIQRKKTAVVERLRQGMQHMLKTQKVDHVSGTAFLGANKTVLVDQTQRIETRYVLLATGSEPKNIEGLRFDHDKIVSSDDVLSWTEVPSRVLIVGAGVIGCEFACFLKRLGSAVTVVEMLEHVVPGIDGQVSQKLEQAMKKAGIQVYLKKSVFDLDLKDYDKVIVAIGRSARMKGLWHESLNIRTERGIINVDRELRTGERHVFAAGDCIGGYMLAHVAAYEGELAVNNMFGRSQKRDYSVIPASIFTYPEIGTIGISEEEAQRFGVNCLVKTVHYLSVGMAHVLEDTQGFIKVIVDQKSGRILGAHIIGLEATELVNFFSLAMKNGVTVGDIGRTIFAHPGVSEIVAEVARAFA